MAYTKGPWRVENRYIVALKRKVVAEVPCGGVIHQGVDNANAHLIAAAPQLYEALKEAKDVIRHLGNISNIPDSVYKAIAKAEGL